MKALILFLCSFVFLFAHDTPYSQKKFQDILRKSKLQAPVSSYDPLYSTNYGKFKDFSNRYFYLQDGKYMAFEMCGKKNRSELRLKDEWRVETTQSQTLFAKLKIFPLNQKKEFTFLQIHTNLNHTGANGQQINKPLLRLTWQQKQQNRHNHLWAVIRLSGDVNQQKYTKIDLGVKPKDFFTVKIEVKKSTMKIFINKKLKINMKVDYWNGYWNYCKAGVYNQGKGCDKVLFETLDIR